MIEQLFYFIILALFAEIIGTVGGFGSSMFFVPIAGYFMDFYSVLGITALYHVISNTTKIYFFRKGYNKRLIISLGIPAVIFVVLGAILSKYLGVELLQISLAIVLITVSLVLLIFKNIFIRPTTGNAIAGGVLSGFIAGLVGTGGAIRGITLSAFNLKPEVFIATSAIIDLAIDLSRSVTYTMNGYVHSHDLYLIPILMVVSITGTFTGKRILDFIPEKNFKTIVLSLILIIGVLTLCKYCYA